MDYSYLIQQILTYLASLGLLTNNFNGYCPEGYLGANCEIGNYTIDSILFLINYNLC